MAACVDNDLWLQSRRIAVTKSKIAVLDEGGLWLTEMSDAFSPDSVAARMEALQKDLDYQRNVLVAMQARMAVRRLEQTTMTNQRLAGTAVAA
jgi:predicted component of type VI protein secretion system